jgi:ATP-dependent DNA helicase DinG
MVFLDKFPSGFTPRPTQVKIVNDIENAINSGYRRILLCAPTGIGKSHIAITLAKQFGRSFVVTAQKQLQDQYVSDFPFLHAIKGKSTYPCLDLMKERNVHTKKTAMQLGLNCSIGVCEKGKKKIRLEDGFVKEVPDYCKHKPSLDDFQVSDQGLESEQVNCTLKNACLYYEKKYAAGLASHGIFNYDSYFQAKKYSSILKPYMDRPVMIFDEAHEIEDRIIGFIGIDIVKTHLTDVGLSFDNYDVTDLKLVEALLEDLIRAYSGLNKDITWQRRHQKEVTRIKNRLERFRTAYDELIQNRENFIVNNVERDDKNKITSVSIRPLDISQYAEQFFDAPHQIFMSATLSKNMLCNMTGFDPDKVAFIDVEKSPFPKENRKITFLNTRFVSWRSTPEDKTAVIEEIDKIMQKHANERGLILTSSIAYCYEIKNQLSESSAKRIRMLHSQGDEDKKTKEEILKEHAEKGNSVLLSSSAWVGLDLKDDLSRFQIIAKVPYPNLSEKRVKIKMGKNQGWYDNVTLIKLLQGFGRSVRSESDIAVTYVLDGNARKLLDKMRSHVPKSFHDVLFA